MYFEWSTPLKEPLCDFDNEEFNPIENAGGARRDMGNEQFKRPKAHDNPINGNAKQDHANCANSKKGDSKQNKNHSKVNNSWIANLTEVGAHDSQDPIPPMM